MGERHSFEVTGLKILETEIRERTTLKYESKSHYESDIPVSDQSFHGRGVIQPTLWADDENHIHMLLRSTEGKIYRSDSADGGISLVTCGAHRYS